MKRFLKRSAFTIIEMVIVIAVIGILATVMIPTISGMIEKANKSADTQFAASLTIQLAMESVDGGIKNETDLRDAVNKYYGTEEEPDYYNKKLAPKSSKSGNYFWYDYNNGTVFVGTVKEAAEKSAEIMGQPAPAQLNAAPVNTPVSGTFSPASLRSDLFPGLYLMGCGGKEGDLVETITKFEDLDIGAVGGDYQKAIADMYVLQSEQADKEANNPYKQAVEALVSKVETTAIVTSTGVYRYNDVNAITDVYITMSVTEVKLVPVFCYDPNGADDFKVDEGSSAPIAGTGVVKFELPKGVKVANLAMLGFKNDADTSDYLINTTTLYVDATEAELKTIFGSNAVDCVIQLPNGARYVIEDDSIYPLPRKDAEGNDVPPVHSGLNNEGLKDLDFSITCDDDTDDYLTEGGKLYLTKDGENTILYVAVDIANGQFDLGVEKVSPNMVTWVSKNTDMITIDAKSGLATINPCADFINKPVTIEASLTGGEPESVTIYVLKPISGSFEVNGEKHEFPNNPSNKLSYSYTGSEIKLVISNILAKYEDVYVECGNAEGVLTAVNGLFTCVQDAEAKTWTLTLDPSKLEDTVSTYTFTVKCGNYFEQTFTIEVTDDSSDPIQCNPIVDKEGTDNDILIGDDYLFRVGNQGAISLGTLFNGDNLAAGNITIEVLDITAKTGTVAGPIATTGNGFKATIPTGLTDTNWSSKTITFSGTGVAQIILTTADGAEAKLLVEVVNAKNVTAIGGFSDSTSGNYVVLKSFSAGTSRVGTISGVIYGNGFTIDASAYKNTNGYNFIELDGGVIDNIIINGPVYPVVALYTASGTTPGKESGYYVNGVSVKGTAQISNSYISGFRSAVQMAGDKLTMVNTTVEGGVYANVTVSDGDLVLTNVTTIQRPTQSTFDDKPTVLGAGIVCSTKAAAESSEITLNGTFEQYNWVSEDDAKYLPSDYQSAFKDLFKNTTYVHDGKYMNTAFVFGGTRTIGINDNRTDKTLVIGDPIEKTVLSTTGTIITYKDNDQTVTLIPADYVPKKQADYLPTFSYTDMPAAPDANSDSHYYDATENAIRVVVTANQTYTFDPTVGVIVEKYSGKTLTANVHSVDTGISKNDDGTITVSAAGEYTITLSASDEIIYDLAGNILPDKKETRYETVKVIVGVKDIPDAVISIKTPTKSDIYVLHNNNGFDPDWGFAIPLDLITITDNDTTIGGDSFKSVDSLPAGFSLTVTGSSTAAGSEQGGPGWKLASYNNKLWIVSTGMINNATAKSLTFTFTYVGASGNEAKTADGGTPSITVNFPKGTYEFKLFGGGSIWACEGNTATVTQHSNFKDVTTDKIIVNYK